LKFECYNLINTTAVFNISVSGDAPTQYTT